MKANSTRKYFILDDQGRIQIIGDTLEEALDYLDTNNIKADDTLVGELPFTVVDNNYPGYDDWNSQRKQRGSAQVAEKGVNATDNTE